MRILVVDDDASCRQITAKLVERLGKALLASDGAEAVTMFEQAQADGAGFELVFLDIQMPNKDGQQALREIRAAEEKAGIWFGDGAKIIMTTSLSDATNVLTSFRAGCETYLVKPITREKLEEALRKLGLVSEE